MTDLKTGLPSGLSDAKNSIDNAFTRRNLRGLNFENAFAGATSFMRRKYTKDLAGVDLAVTGVPFDQAVTNRPGARFGPRAVREASTLQTFDPPYGWDVDPFSTHVIIDYGDLAFDYAHTQSFPYLLKSHIKGILQADVASLSLGGDHYISFPIMQAYAEKYGSLSLLQFDAHSDTWPDNDMERIDHGTMFYKAVKMGLINPDRSVQVGIRSTIEDPMGVHIIDAPDVHEKGTTYTIDKIKEILGNNKTYVTFDIDCLDPAFAPGTGTPVWGGFSSAQAASILRGLSGINMVGGDVVEVSPPFDSNGSTAVAGAHAAVELICLWAAGKAVRA